MGRPILTPTEMRNAEKALIASGADSFELMRRAGVAVGEFVHAQWPEGVIQVLCGHGGNGGDGFVAAAHLKTLWRDVEVFCTKPIESLDGDAAKAAAAWGGVIRPLEAALEAPHDLVLDALYGAGLSRPLAGIEAQLAERGGRVISVDVPSGIDGARSEPLGPCFRAEGTITFAALRPAHLLFPSSQYCGGVFVADIGLSAPTTLLENSPALWARLLPQPGQSSHKHLRGHLKVVSGGATRTGASRLAAQAGLRTGAGLVSLISPPSAVMVNASHLTAVMLESIRDKDEMADSAQDATVVVIGPAAGVNQHTKENVLALLKSPARIVLDADALTVFEGDTDTLFAALRPTDLLTPHIGEFNRLFGNLLSETSNKVEAVRAAAVRAGCVVLLKGPDTVIAMPSGEAVINTHATKWLATAGAGDVLAGFIAGLMTQGVETFTATSMGVWLHGEAGRRIGAGLVSEDLEKMLPDILSALHGEFKG